MPPFQADCRQYLRLIALGGARAKISTGTPMARVEDRKGVLAARGEGSIKVYKV